MRCFDCFNLKAGDFLEIGELYEAEITGDAKADEVWQRIWDNCNIFYVEQIMLLRYITSTRREEKLKGMSRHREMSWGV